VSENRRVRGPVLVIIGVALIAITTLMLLTLRKRTQRPGDEENEASASSSSTRHAPGVPLPAPSHPNASAVPSPVPASGAVPGAAVRQWKPARLPPYTHRVEATPPVPVEIQNETDPVKKAALTRMHQLTTARVRVSMLRRRRDLLQSSIADARQKGTWTPAKIQDAERQLAELRGAAVRAEQNLNHVRQEVGGDIDKGGR
jgi:hypothetical protein